MASNSEGRRRNSVALIIFGIVLGLVGLVLGAGGVYLATLGGSWYYLVAGLAFVASGILYARGKLAGAWVYGALTLATIAWALAEVGLAFWPMIPRLSGVLVLAVPALLLLPSLQSGSERSAMPSRAVAGALVVALLATLGFMFVPHGVIDTGVAPVADGAASGAVVNADWSHYGRTPAGTRFAPFDQINKDNVGQLKLAWSMHTGDVAGPGSEDQNTPLQVGDTLYVCTPHNRLIAVDADSGKERWRFDPKAADTGMWNRCRGVSYFDAAAFAAQAQLAPEPAPAAPGGATAAPAACATRIVMSTIDDRLMQLDAKTGQPCADFGDGGTVNLRAHMGEIKKAFYFTTSAPTVANGLIVIGGWVQDNQAVDEPSGVVRAFHADTGKLAWAWDLGNPAITGEPPAGQTYTRGTPNMWSTPAFDEKLGLIYLPLGNSPPDYFGAHRTPEAEKYGSAIVALDIKSGRERWKFQTVHHDLWDYDLPSQPALYDLPDGKGGVTPALIQLSKSGNIFMLDRRDGKAIAEVRETPVPHNPAPGDFNAPTQPISVGMPQIGTAQLSEASMWGATPFDQLYCRIAFKKLRYDGAYTPPNVTPSLQYPGNFGGMNWGSASINEDTGMLIVNDIRMPVQVSLIARDTYDNGPQAGVHAGGAMKGTPFGLMAVPFMSPLAVPCQAPPYGTVTGIDLKTRKIVWQRPAGTLADTVMAGVRLSLPIPLGLPTLGGTASTRSGLVFAAGTQDFYLRALDQNTGKELWKARLPVGAQATPAIYVSPKTGKQYVIINASGARDSPLRGDNVMAFALP